MNERDVAMGSAENMSAMDIGNGGMDNGRMDNAMDVAAMDTTGVENGAPPRADAHVPANFQRQANLQGEIAGRQLIATIVLGLVIVGGLGIVHGVIYHDTKQLWKEWKEEFKSLQVISKISWKGVVHKFH